MLIRFSRLMSRGQKGTFKTKVTVLLEGKFSAVQPIYVYLYQ